MASISDPAQPAFRLSMLVNDTRYRGITFQIIAFLAIVFFFGWLIWNATQNLAALGQDISYKFLGEQAGYDINQQLIPFVSTDTHFRAAMVGILNTLLVAFLGCITATIIGVVVGVLRLSKNWLVAKVMSVYVEIFRNVPVLIWILIIFSVMSNALPSPRDFRGDNATASMVFDAMAFTNRGVYVPGPVWEAGSGIVVAVFLASIVGIFFLRRYATKLLYDTGRELPVLQLSLGLFFVPALIAYFVMGSPIGLDYPELKGFNFQGGLKVQGTLIALWWALALYTGAFIAENVRAGILAVSKGQTEAAAALGLRPGKIMRLVVLPQALRVIIPPLISQYLNLTKNSSLAAAIGYMDITGTLGGITLNQTGRSFEAVLLLMLFYLMISLAISGVMNLYNNAVKLKER
ncbi:MULTISPECIES: amino acid ABC transporter permease [unclassified Meridianimarinicoccus]|uniref:amino acid ABC transporter permease n=1 Tax=unclassified Meridianimarinicoccus TaxID=2923344 RepID=UPI001868FBF0|nr:ABC transporter permease subunit [Fluviibacterium sp. MJW13]